MLNDAIVLLTIAVAGGIVLASSLFRGWFPPLFVSLLHGAFGLLGVIVVLGAVLQPDAPPAIRAALWVLILASLTGLSLTRQRVRKASASARWMVMHISLAIAGFAVVILTTAV